MKQKNTLRFFLDSEFNEHVVPFQLDPISIALVPEDEGLQSLYEVSRDFNAAAITPWLRDNVVVHLPPVEQRHGNAEIRDNIVSWLKDVTRDAPRPDAIEIWAYNGATDQVVLANFFGGLIDLRRAFNEAGLPSPQFRDLKELTRATGEKLPPPENAHDCLEDALWARQMFKHLEPKLSPERRFLVE